MKRQLLAVGAAICNSRKQTCAFAETQILNKVLKKNCLGNEAVGAAQSSVFIHTLYSVY